VIENFIGTKSWRKI